MNNQQTDAKSVQEMERPKSNFKSRFLYTYTNKHCTNKHYGIFFLVMAEMSILNGSGMLCGV